MLTRMMVGTPRRETLEEITERVADVVRASGVRDGICHVIVPHTTAGVTVNEAADPAVAADALNYMAELVPREGMWLHAEGNADAHIKAALLGHSAAIPIEDGELVLGTWQGIFLAEFDGPRARTVLVKVMAG
ncbi:MAG TPA: secondary thiamine-phosphate synthase enzyme YjbQ [Chloroflexota bacterium]|jgi:secondary thiamine-phosphate synthase enzyme|nr:secondary thiamine-phosphate synthase enzyme YjbQ [Chloroflexota bacterium]